MIVAVLAIVQIFGSSVFFVAGIMVPPLSDADGDFGWSVFEITAAISVYYLVQRYICADNRLFRRPIWRPAHDARRDRNVWVRHGFAGFY